MTDPEQHPATLVAQTRPDPSTGALTPPLYATTTYQRDPDNQYRRGRSYGRADNPTTEQPQTLLNALEGGQGCLLFASGMAAATAAFLSLEPGDHVIAPKVMYWGLRNWLLAFAGPGASWSISSTQRPRRPAGGDPPRHDQAGLAGNPRQPDLAITDIAAVADLAHTAGARLAVDRTAATPVLTRPLALGADLVMHSATKYLNGHSDVIAGALVTARADDLWTRHRRTSPRRGAILGPFEAWLLLRGMRTLFRACRARLHDRAYARRTPRANRRVRGPLSRASRTTPATRIAARQMQGGFGGMLSIRVKGRRSRRHRDRCHRENLATRNLARRYRKPDRTPRLDRRPGHSPVPPDLLRLSVGIEHPEDLLADLEQALASAG